MYVGNSITKMNAYKATNGLKGMWHNVLFYVSFWGWVVHLIRPAQPVDTIIEEVLPFLLPHAYVILVDFCNPS